MRLPLLLCLTAVAGFGPHEPKRAMRATTRASTYHRLERSPDALEDGVGAAAAGPPILPAATTERARRVLLVALAIHRSRQHEAARAARCSALEASHGDACATIARLRLELDASRAGAGPTAAPSSAPARRGRRALRRGGRGARRGARGRRRARALADARARARPRRRDGRAARAPATRPGRGRGRAPARACSARADAADAAAAASRRAERASAAPALRAEGRRRRRAARDVARHRLGELRSTRPCATATPPRCRRLAPRRGRVLRHLPGPAAHRRAPTS